MSLVLNLDSVKSQIGSDRTLVAVSKTKPASMINEAYLSGQIDFGENKVQELVEKHESLPKDIRWHMIGHLQRNKVKYIAPFVHLIHGVDSERLLLEINKQGEKNKRTINCLFQVFIAKESTKFGLDQSELFSLVEKSKELKFVKVCGLMGMASNTPDIKIVHSEFNRLRLLFEELKYHKSPNFTMQYLSMGMSNDYEIALREGSNMIRVGSAIFGTRNY